MRRAILAGVFAGLAAAIGAAQIAGAGVVERIRVSDPARQAHGLPPGLVLELTSPPDYARADSDSLSGTWAGPAWIDRDTGEQGLASITWRASFDDRPAQELEQVVARNLRHPDWQRDQRGGLTIDRVMGRRLIGAMVGYFYVMTPGGHDARIEAVLAFPLDQSLFAVIELELT